MKRIGNIALDRCELISELVKDKVVLDIGCVEHDLANRERGHWLHDHIKRTAAMVVGLDYEEEAVQKLRDEGYDVVSADATNFDLDKTFDAIVAGELIEHVLNPAGFLRCARKHLRPDGMLLLTTPNANCLIYFLENVLIGREIDNPDHVCIYSPTTIQRLMEKSGFRVERVIFLAENTSHCHKSKFHKFLVQIKQLVQITAGLLRPSLCHHFLVIARPLAQR